MPRPIAPSRIKAEGAEERRRYRREVFALMPVYVDDMRAKYGRMIMCHMIADTDDELHAMADRIGVARRWFQGDHYDICLAKRTKAVAHGAIELTRMELGRKAIAKRRAQARGA